MTSVGSMLYGKPEVAVPEAVLQGMGKIQGRSLGQIAWLRLKRDKVALAGAVVIVLLILVAVFAPLIVKVLPAAR